MPSGIRINWEQYDNLIRQYLPTMTVEEFTRSHLSEFSSKAVGARARKLKVKPGRYKLSEKHKAKIATAISRPWTTEEDNYLLLRAPTATMIEMAGHLGVDDTTVWRRLKRLGFVYDTELKSRKYSKAAKQSLAKPEVKAKLSAAAKGRILSEDHKRKISQSLCGCNNGMFGRTITDEQRKKWRESYFANGVYRVRAWLRSDAGQAHLKLVSAKANTPENRRAASLRMANAVAKGLINTNRGKPSRLSTKKGGTFTTKSSYETRFVNQLEADNSVVAFQYEPFTIDYVFDGQLLCYRPDFLVIYVDGNEELIEVKPKKLTTLPKNVAKINAGLAYHSAFRVVSEDDLWPK